MSLAGGRLECSSLPRSATCTEREMSWPALSSQNSEHKARNTSLTYRKWIYDGELQRRRPIGQCLNKGHKVKVQRKMCQRLVLSCYVWVFLQSCWTMSHGGEKVWVLHWYPWRPLWLCSRLLQCPRYGGIWLAKDLSTKGLRYGVGDAPRCPV